MTAELAIPLPWIAAAGAAWAGVCAYLWWMDRRTLSDIDGWRRRAALLLRVFIVTLLFLALAGLHMVRSTDALDVVFVVDASRSVLPAERQRQERFVQDAVRGRRPADRAGVVTFARGPLASAPGTGPLPADLRHGGAADATDIRSALQAALALVAPGRAGKVVLLSDGGENVGSAMGVVPSLTARGVRVEAVPAAEVLQREALVERVEAPASARIGEPFRVRVLTNTLTAQTARLTVWHDAAPSAAARVVRLGPGRDATDFELRLPRPGAYRIRTRLEPAPGGDTLAQNNRGEALVTVRGRPRVLYVGAEGRSTRLVREALRRQNVDAQIVPADAMPTTAAALQGFDSVVLSNVPASAFSRAQMAALHGAVRDVGVGLVMVGGEESFGAGGYRGTRIAEALPVSLDLRQTRRFPPVALALVIDRSGSMAEGPPGATKLDFAKEAASRAVQFVKPTDRVAVASFTERALVEAPLTSARRQEDLLRRIAALSTGGGTSVIAGAQVGFEIVAGAPEPRRHVLQLTDGLSNADDAYRDLTERMTASRVTFSAVVVGAGTGARYAGDMAALARATGGRVWEAEQPADLPSIFMQEVERISTPSLLEEPFRPRFAPEAAERLPGVPGATPPLLGYNVTEARQGADVLMTSHRGDPVLASWRYGLGRVMAFTSDDRSKWAAHWVPWEGYARFWAEAIRWTLRSSVQGGLYAQVTHEGSRGRVEVEAVDAAGVPANRLQLEARVVGGVPDGAPEAEPVALRQTGPGRYEAWFDAAREGAYLVSLVRRDGGRLVPAGQVPLVVAYPAEYRDLRPNTHLLEQLARVTGGRVLAEPGDVFGSNRPRARTARSLAGALVLAALLLFPLDVAVRRVALQREDLARAAAWLRGLRGVRREPGPSSEAMGRLRAARDRARPRPDEARVPPAIARQGDTPPRAPAEPPAELPEQQPASPQDAMERLKAARRRARRGGDGDEA